MAHDLDDSELYWTRKQKGLVTESETEKYIRSLEKKVNELDQDLTTVYMSGFYDGEKKCKDKINKKIEELNNYYKKEVYPTKHQWADINITEFWDNQIELLQELLRKEK